MEYYVGDRDLKRMPQRRLNFIGGSISSYCSILHSPERLEKMRQTKKLASVLYDLDYDSMENDEKKKIVTDAEENRRRKSKEKQVKENEDTLRGLESCEALVRSV